MAAETNVPAYLWKEFFRAATYIQNRSSTCALSFRTPYQKLFDRKFDMSKFRVIGSFASIWIPKDPQNELESKSKLNTIMGGYDTSTKSYQLNCPDEKKDYTS
jgi:hypothetical protein